MAGAGLYWGRGEAALLALAEQLRIPVFTNGLARGCIPADHELAFSRARRTGLPGADVALVIGAPLDFRLGFGAAFAPDAEVVAVDVAEPDQAPPRAAGGRAVRRVAGDARRAASRRPARPMATPTARRGSARCVPPRTTRVPARRPSWPTIARPFTRMRVYGELMRVLDRDAIVVGDGGDFVSYAGRVLDSHHPGCWLDPGPLGCLGCGPGYALAAKLAHPERPVVLLLGDGAFGFSGMELDTLARHGVAVLVVVGNNGIWALEKHPMETALRLLGRGRAPAGAPATTRSPKPSGATASSSERPPSLRPALERALGPRTAGGGQRPDGPVRGLPTPVEPG